MITLYTWTTPNGRKVPIMLEELGWPYEVKPVDIGRDEQFSPEFLRVSPNNKIPALVDDEADGGPLSVFESGAILVYLADKSGRFLAPSGPARYKALEWLFWQVGGQGPMLGQLGFFAKRSEEKAPLAIGRFTDEAARLLGVLERRLSEAPFLAGEDYGIADMATYPWTIAAKTFLKDVLAESLASKPSMERWLKAVGDRPAVQRGMAVPKVS
ncbi:glutathione S-transferase N-terminal domain-containing protein [Microvirga pudoricolor]|uniref:glutathione S-transferase N-terminal domain-containing protein n=1 Tax=Microvirga pudoricolor TaxID=2778729 RepID=UPI00195096AF|nr:glutathione S-transferase N-terminal domain-containing protein [Microvirga pudoricolor]MBM6594443.1 glutathione S-transferase N-terminal domain-containing protein [Microvirga pudoricolor]